MRSPTPYDDIIARAASLHGLPADFVWAVCAVESSFNPYAWNPEPPYRYLWDVRARKPFRVLTPSESASERPPADFPVLAGDRDQEWWGQQASWGLMQIMGAVARERGFSGPYLPELTDPVLNLDIGCAHLAWLARRWFGSYGPDGILAAYNTGGPNSAPGTAGAGYVAKVRARWDGRWNVRAPR